MTGAAYSEEGQEMHYRGIALREHKGEWYFEDPDLAEPHNPTGPEHEKRAAWMAKTGAAECGAWLCLGKVLRGRAHTCGSMYGPGARDKIVCDTFKRKWHAWFDHAELFWLPESREYVLTAQPYDLTLAKFQEMEAFAEAQGLQVDVSLEDAWWYPGRTPLVVWRRT